MKRFLMWVAAVAAALSIALASAPAASAAQLTPVNLRESGRGDCIGGYVVTVETAQAGTVVVQAALNGRWETWSTFTVPAGNSSRKVSFINAIGNVPNDIITVRAYLTVNNRQVGGADACVAHLT